MKIVTDCAADIPAQELDELGIVQAPLFIRFPEGEVNSADISADEFYNRLEAMRPAIPSTAQPSSGIFSDLYHKAAQAGQDILSLHISSGLSGTINAARAGIEEAALKVKATVWDTMTLSGGERFQVLAASLAAKAGWTLHAIQQRLEQIRSATEVVYTLDTLEYLARGGRIGRVQAIAGSLLHLKPVIHVEHSDGKYSTVATARTAQKSIQAIANHLVDLYASVPLWVTVLHGRAADNAESLSNTLKEQLNVARLEMMRISPVLGVHTGPGIVGAAVVPIALMQDLVK